MAYQLSEFEFIALVIVALVVGLLGGNYLKTLNPLLRCKYNNYILIFMVVSLYLMRYWNDKSCHCDDNYNRRRGFVCA